MNFQEKNLTKVLHTLNHLIIGCGLPKARHGNINRSPSLT
jgi:hypothetical protein